MSPNRVVAVLTPLVFAPLAGAVAAWLAKHFPAAQISQDDIQAIFIGGALLALAPAMQWLHGWQKYEARQANAEHALELAGAGAGAGAGAVQEADQDDEHAGGTLQARSVDALLDELDALDGLDRSALERSEG